MKNTVISENILIAPVCSEYYCSAFSYIRCRMNLA